MSEALDRVKNHGIKKGRTEGRKMHAGNIDQVDIAGGIPVSVAAREAGMSSETFHSYLI